METKTFHLGDLLSITTSLLVSPRYMDGVYEVIAFLHRAPPGDLSLSDAIGDCRLQVLDQHPELAAIDTTDVSFESWREWLDARIADFGEWQSLSRPLI